MSRKVELRLEALPGILKGSWFPKSGKAMPAGVAEFSLRVPLWPASTRQDMIRRLSGCPNDMYALLQDRAPGWFSRLELLPEDAELRPAEEEDMDNATDEDMLLRVRAALAEQPLLVLKLRGFPKEELFDAVLLRWAQAAAEAKAESGTAAPSPGLAAELARLERKGPAVSSGEWLAEAAAEGSLHQPGALFHEVGERPFPANPLVAPAAENWQALLPQTPRVQVGLELITRHVAEAAARRARLQNNS